ncbi:hypothetical protein CR513_51234, partial [Mucuna pruriens]
MLVGYCDTNYVGDQMKRRNTNRGKQKTRNHNPICYISKIMNQLKEYNIFESNISLLYDNIVVINLSKNCILHSRAKLS